MRDALIEERKSVAQAMKPVFLFEGINHYEWFPYQEAAIQKRVVQ